MNRDEKTCGHPSALRKFRLRPEAYQSSGVVLAIVFLGVVVFGVCAQQGSPLFEVGPLRVTQPITLFNGKDLSGWTTWLVDTRREDPRKVFTVRDGLLRISGDGFGYLSTKASYRDYRLVVEFKWGDKNWRHRVGKARDAGLFLHSVGPDGNSFDGEGAYKAAIECQIMEGAVGDFLLIKGKDEKGRAVPVGFTASVAAERDPEGWFTWDPKGTSRRLDQTGRLNWRSKEPAWEDRFGFRGKQDVESPAGEWTRLECECRRESLRVWVNGTLVNVIEEVRPSAGTILLQCEGSEIFFRKVELLPLDP